MLTGAAWGYVMGEFMFGTTHIKPTRMRAKGWDRACKAAGGTGYTEVNVTPDRVPWVNDGRYQCWFTADDQGEPFNGDLARRVFAAIGGV